MKARELTPEKIVMARVILDEIRAGRDVLEAIRANPLPVVGHLGKHTLVGVYRHLVETGEWQEDETFLRKIRMKPSRTLSGVTTVTVLTKPHICPGQCIFCPDDERMPKSYLPDEPGAARAFQNAFDPYMQVKSRLDAYYAVGHPTDKIELLILGGTWSAYPRDYQEWFIKRCFDAMNEEESAILAEAHHKNQNAKHRNVGLVIETRPDQIDPHEIRWLRQMGVTKVQLGAQSLDDRILALNQRGHTPADTLNATALLRAAGFKIVLHWMPNLLGADPQSDRVDFARLWQSATDGLGYCPDELKIYPTQLLEETALYDIWKKGQYQPYSTDTLIDLIAEIKPSVPEYCRINRVIRDIPSNHVVEGNKRTSLRQDISEVVKERGSVCRCIRCREVRHQKVNVDELAFEDFVYHPAHSEEHFLSYVTSDDKLAGYLRLSFPTENAPKTGMPDLDGAAIIREVHVYGQSVPVGEEQSGAAQHIGLGTELLQIAERLAAKNGYKRMAVIAAIGTREYYSGRGFENSEHYMVKELEK
ncbi:MAG: tRNA uridine(34) 5-carboxymethylaminomethyl modification radical SAM/GNAT enzyme Elp3 [Anaerolineaceae bacterium]|nr:tRNA uridine(34) 5-carboxymethylaminomethyl modification radical SAM/GNAT enzyme Elp3 [Anaerolineaceae bacterium]